MSTRSVSITRVAWGILVVDGIALLIASLVRHAALQVLLYCALVPLSLFPAVTWLVWIYRVQLGQVRGWLAVVLAFVGVSILQGIPQATSSLSLLMPMLLLAAMWLVFLVSGLFFWKRDAGLPVLAWGSLLGIWLTFFLWRSQGNLLLHLLAYLETSERSLAIQVLEPLVTLVWCLLPLGLLGFVGHTIRLIAKELGEGVV